MFKYHDPISVIVSRVFLSIIFLLSGISGFYDIGLGEYFTLNESIVGSVANLPHFYILKSIEIVIGLCFLSNFFVQTALLVAMPIALSAIGYQFWVLPIKGVITTLMLVPLVVLFQFYKDTFKIFFRPQIYSNHMAEDSPKILIYDEVREKSPKLLSKFEEIHVSINR